MTLQLNQIVPSITILHEMVKDTLHSKYKCELIHDRFSINFSHPKKCVLIKKSAIIGVGIFVNEKKNTIDVDGIVPNQILDRVVFGNYITRLLLLRPWKLLEGEVTKILAAKLQVRFPTVHNN
jgi:hypothetical protein